MGRRGHRETIVTAAGFLATVLFFAVTAPVGAGVVISPPIDPADAETAWRWIGLLPNGPGQSCPEPQPADGWTTAAMFPATANSQLARYCLYTRETPGDATPLLTLGLEKIETDHMAVAPEGSLLRDRTWQRIESSYREQAGRPSGAGYGDQQVRLTLIDTEPTQIAIGDNGLVVGWTAQDLGQPMQAMMWEGCIPVPLNQVTAIPLSERNRWEILERATAIDDAGRIAGVGRAEDGAPRAFILTPLGLEDPDATRVSMR